MTEIIVDDVSKQFGSLSVLEAVSMRLESGSVHGLVGPNGSGKTTLFRILLGLDSPTSGSVRVPDSRIGCGFQQPRFYGDLTVAENLEVFGSLAGADRDWLAELRDRCSLVDHRERLAADLSDGLAKKLDFALAFVDRPAVALLDEPFADVDDDSKQDLLDFLDSYRSRERTVVVTTHQLRTFRDLLDTLTIVVDGDVVFEGRIDAGSVDGNDLMSVYHEHLPDYSTAAHRGDGAPDESNNRSAPTGLDRS